MGRQLKINEWLQVFDLYENYKNNKISKRAFEYEYLKICGSNKIFNRYVIRWIKIKIKKYNLGMNIESKTGKSPKKGKGSGRPRKKFPLQEIENRKRALKEISKEDLEWIVDEFYYDEILKKYNTDSIEEVIKKIKNKKNLSTTIKNIIDILGIKKSTFYYKLKHLSQLKREKKVTYEEEIREAFKECKGRYGRERLSLLLKKKYKININPRTLGRNMNKLGLFCEVRQRKRKRENKNLNTKFKNLVKRDYDGIYNDVYATDVTYIPSPKDVYENHVYLSVIIQHRTKKAISWNLSKVNDNNLVLDHFKHTIFPTTEKFIIHSDHGIQYSSQEFVSFINSINGVISMSRIGNSLDNREIEYFFSILKTEIFPNFYQNVKTLTFIELKNKIKEFIDWYNNERFLKKFNLKTPQELWDVYNNKNFTI